MSDNVIKATFGKAPEPADSAVVKSNVSIVMNGRALFTSEPTNKDVDFFGHITGARQKWIKEGRPQSCSQMQ